MYVCACVCVWQPLRFNDSQTVTIVVIMHEKLKNLTTSTSSSGNNCGNLSADVYLCSSQLCHGAGGRENCMEREREGEGGYVSRAFQLCAHAALFAQRIEQCSAS